MGECAGLVEGGEQIGRRGVDQGLAHRCEAAMVEGVDVKAVGEQAGQEYGMFELWMRCSRV